MGDPDAADQGLIPDVFWLDDPGWVATGEYWAVACAYDLLIDIQLDNTHAPFVHPDTLGSSAITDTAPRVERTDRTVSAGRWMMDVVRAYFPVRLDEKTSTGGFVGRLHPCAL